MNELPYAETILKTELNNEPKSFNKIWGTAVIALVLLSGLLAFLLIKEVYPNRESQTVQSQSSTQFNQSLVPTQSPEPNVSISDNETVNTTYQTDSDTVTFIEDTSQYSTLLKQFADTLEYKIYIPAHAKINSWTIKTHYRNDELTYREVSMELNIEGKTFSTYANADGQGGVCEVSYQFMSSAGQMQACVNDGGWTITSFMSGLSQVEPDDSPTDQRFVFGPDISRALIESMLKQMEVF